MQNLIIRPVRRADLHGLRTMITALAAHHGDVANLDLDHLNRDIFGAHPWVRIAVASIGADLVGYYALCPLIQLQYCQRGMDIHHLYVHDDHRSQGVGRALIEDTISCSRRLACRYLMVGTAPDNIAAQNTYLACGFTRTDHNPNRFYRDIN